MQLLRRVHRRSAAHIVSVASEPRTSRAGRITGRALVASSPPLSSSRVQSATGDPLNPFSAHGDRQKRQGDAFADWVEKPDLWARTRKVTAKQSARPPS